ncbi:hypothetical protein D3C87_1956710 [compost metagenome]
MVVLSWVKLRICSARKVRSPRLISDTSAVSLRFCTARLPKEGIISGIAWGMVTVHSVWRGVKLRARAASCWSLWTDWMAPRTTSAP